jgi:hypothetical protein
LGRLLSISCWLSLGFQEEIRDEEEHAKMTVKLWMAILIIIFLWR